MKKNYLLISPRTFERNFFQKVFLYIKIPLLIFVLILSACPRPVPKHGLRNDNRANEIEAYIKSEISSERDAWQKPDEVIEALFIKEGSIVADVGAGAGYFTSRLATAVGENGTVYATETLDELVELLVKNTTERGLTNVKVIKATPENPRLPYASLDLAFVCNNLSRVDLVYVFFDQIRRSLKTGGRLAVIDWKEDSRMGGDPKLRRSKKEIIKILTGMGFVLIKDYDFLPEQYFLVFSLKERFG